MGRDQTLGILTHKRCLSFKQVNIRLHRLEFGARHPTTESVELFKKLGWLSPGLREMARKETEDFRRSLLMDSLWASTAPGSFPKTRRVSADPRPELKQLAVYPRGAGLDENFEDTIQMDAEKGVVYPIFQ